MTAAEQVQFSLQVMIMKESNKVIYAEVDSDFADVLFSFLTLPLGTILGLLAKHFGDNTPAIGSLSSLFVGLLNLDSGHFWTEACRQMLLTPRNSSEIECRRRIDDTPPTRYYMRGNRTCVSMYYNVKCPCTTSTNMKRMDVESVAHGGDKSVFTFHRASFLLTDDLCIMTNTAASLFRILKRNGIKDSTVLEERTVPFGSKEIMDLLKGSLLSETDIILSRKMLTVSAKREPNASPQTQTCENIRSECKKITVKVLVQKSTNRILLAQKPRGQDSFVKGPATFMVTESLQVSTASSNFIISTLRQMEIPFSDVDEQELDIGIQEALSILKASLASTCALSEGLKPFLKRQPKREK